MRIYVTVFVIVVDIKLILILNKKCEQGWTKKQK